MQNVPLIPPSGPTQPPKKKSALLPVGIGFLVAGIALPRPLTQVAESMPNGLLRAVLFLGTDVFRLCFFVGVTLIIIGALRNRKSG